MEKKRRKGWKHITERERYLLEYMLKDGMKVVDIAVELGHSKSTIYREIKRGKVLQRNSDYTEEERYLADYAQRDYNEKKHEKGRYLKVGNDMDFVRYVEHMIKDKKYSPVAVLYDLHSRDDIKTRVCHRTLYTYIHSGIFLNVCSGDLPYKVSRKREKERAKIALRNIKGTSIEKRPREIWNRETFGHWEMDTVYGGKNTSLDCLLVLTERMTRYEEVYHIKSRTQEEVCRVLDDVERKIGIHAFIERYKTITSDNGVEFLDFQTVQRSVQNPEVTRTAMYYCHPFCSGERGSNENQNKLIRRWIPKGADIAPYREQIPAIQDWINNYPRKMFGGMSSVEFMEFAGIA